MVATPEVSCCCEDLSLSQRFSILAQTHLWHAHDHPPAFALRAAQHGLAYECPRLSILVAPRSALCCASQMAWPYCLNRHAETRVELATMEVLRETLNSRQTEILSVLDLTSGSQVYTDRNNRQPYGSLSNVLRKPAGEDGSRWRWRWGIHLEVTRHKC